VEGGATFVVSMSIITVHQDDDRGLCQEEPKFEKSLLKKADVADYYIEEYLPLRSGSHGEVPVDDKTLSFLILLLMDQGFQDF
jgi:hypothetical protein